MYKRIIAFLVVSFAGLNCIAGGVDIFIADFDRDKVASVLQEERFASEWKSFLASAEALCDQDSKSYADPAAVDQGFEHQATPTRGSLLCRRLHKNIETLGFAYHFTGRDIFAEHGIKLILAACDKLAIDGDIMSVNLPGGRGDMIRSLSFAYALLGENMTREQKHKVFLTGKAYVEDAVSNAQNPDTGWYQYHNWNGVNGGAIGLFALAIEPQYQLYAKKWQRDAVEILTRWLENGFDKQGAYYEGVSYSSYGLDNTLLFFAGMLNVKDINYFTHPTLKRLPEFYALSLLPGEKVYDARNNSNYGGIRAQVLGLAKFNDNALAKWLWHQTANAVFWQKIAWNNDTASAHPAKADVPLAKHFTGRGLCVWRTGWESNDVMFSIEAGKYHAVTHNQADKGHFTLYGYGYRWSCDPGYANDKLPQGRGQTIAHSCVLIDGKGQALSGAGLGTDGKIVKYTDNQNYGYALADLADAYNRNNKGSKGVGVDKAFRHTIFVKPTDTAPAYAVVLDDISKGNLPREYTWQLISWIDLKYEIDGSNAIVLPKDGKSDAKMFVFIDAQSKPLLKSDIFKPNDNRKPSEFARLRAVSKSANPYFAAVLVPTDGGEEPKVDFENTPDTTIINVSFAAQKHTLTWDKTTLNAPVITFD